MCSYIRNKTFELCFADDDAVLFAKALRNYFLGEMHHFVTQYVVTVKSGLLFKIL